MKNSGGVSPSPESFRYLLKGPKKGIQFVISNFAAYIVLGIAIGNVIGGGVLLAWPLRMMSADK